jgi:hypothetical protein
LRFLPGTTATQTCLPGTLPARPACRDPACQEPCLPETLPARDPACQGHCLLGDLPGPCTWRPCLETLPARTLPAQDTFWRPCCQDPACQETLLGTTPYCQTCLPEDPPTRQEPACPGTLPWTTCWDHCCWDMPGCLLGHCLPRTTCQTCLPARTLPAVRPPAKDHCRTLPARNPPAYQDHSLLETLYSLPTKDPFLGPCPDPARDHLALPGP